MTSLPEVLAALQAGTRLKYILFWGHTRGAADVGPWVFSQWYPSAFTIDGLVYPTAEHFMMAAKARLFGDEEMEREILAHPEPGAAKRFGRSVKHFDQGLWEQHRMDIAVAGNAAKFGQDPALGRYLLQTDSRVLVEASPVDAIWGIGLAADHPDALSPAQWPGTNLLGFALMIVREQLRTERAAP